MLEWVTVRKERPVRSTIATELSIILPAAREQQGNLGFSFSFFLGGGNLG